MIRCLNHKFYSYYTNMVIYKCDLCGNTLERDTTGIVASQFIFNEKQEIARGFRIPKKNEIPIVRIEQLFPLPVEQLKAIIAKYPNADDYVWAQEEPKNMGAYSFMLMNFDLVKWRLASLKAYAAPASGSYTRAKRRHADAIRMVFDKNLFR